MENAALSRLEQLKAFLEADPQNPPLLRDAANAALEANEVSAAFECFSKLDGIEPLAGAEANVAGIAAMRSGNQEAAQRWFATALEAHEGDAGLRFNMAWSKALAHEYEDAVATLDEDVIRELPQAAMLDLQIAHQLGQFEEAEAKMDVYLKAHPNYEPLLAAASVLAMDVNRPDLARETALKAGANPDALATLGTLNLAENRLDEAEAQFEQALATAAQNPRAEIGRGLVAMARGDHGKAARAIDIGAAQFGTHLGSWIASGWAYLLADDRDTARDRFETAMDIDDRFAEAHGSLAVLAALDGELEKAGRGAKVALRLDPESFSAIFCKILIQNAKGRPEVAEKLFESALNQPILPDGTKLLDMLARSLSRAG